MSSSNVPMVQQNAIAVAEFSQDKIALIKATIAKDATDTELELFLYQCQRTGLDPLARQIYFVKFKSQGKSQVSIQTSIDGFRLIAERTGNYEGQGVTKWCGESGVWQDVWLDDDPPRAAKATIYRKGWEHPIVAVARYASYVQTRRDGKVTVFWHNMPDVMLAKCAESLALRKAFPQDLSNLYTQSEMGQAQNAPAQTAQQKRDNAPPADSVNGRRKAKPKAANGNETGQRSAVIWDAFIPVLAKMYEMTEEQVKDKLGDLSQYAGSADAKAAMDADSPPAADGGWDTWSVDSRRAFWATANDLNLSNDGVHQEFGVESMKDYAESQDTARAILEILDYGINKAGIGLQDLWKALGVDAAYKYNMTVDDAKAAIDGWAEAQDKGQREMVNQENAISGEPML